MSTGIIIGVFILVAVLLLAMVFFIRQYRFKPNTNKQMQQYQLNMDLKPLGFAYDKRGDYFYSLKDCWQREMGYCSLYDKDAPFFNMIIDYEPVTFSYAGKRWLIEFWKGQYGITTGAEIGIYNTDREDIVTDKFTGTFYESVTDDEMLPMSFVLKKNEKILLSRNDTHWWLTGFKLGEYSTTDALTLDATISFPSKEMCRAFTEALYKIGYQKDEFYVRQKTVSIRFTTPHTPQNRNKTQDAIVQQINKYNCELYHSATSKYTNTLDKLEYLKATMSEVYLIFERSIYVKELYKAFDWIQEIVHGDSMKRPKSSETAETRESIEFLKSEPKKPTEVIERSKPLEAFGRSEPSEPLEPFVVTKTPHPICQPCNIRSYKSSSSGYNNLKKYRCVKSETSEKKY